MMLCLFAQDFESINQFNHIIYRSLWSLIRGVYCFWELRVVVNGLVDDGSSVLETRLALCKACLRSYSCRTSSVKRSSNEILNIMTSNPSVTTTNNPNPNQPNIIAVVPTPLFTLPFPRSCTIVDAATAAVCCHMMLTRINTEEMKIVARATCETGREGKGLTSVSEPDEEVSVCQPGKVASRRKVRKARTMATMLEISG